MRDFATSLKSPQTGTWTQNDLQVALSNSKILEILGDIRYMSSISAQNFSSIDDDYKEISLSKEIDFKTETETLDA